MYDYKMVRVDATPCNEVITDLVADALAEIGYESFEPDDHGVNAYIRMDLYNKDALLAALDEFPVSTSFAISEEMIKGENWNKEWEQNYFRPIDIDGKCVVRSSFHTVAPKAEIEILIDPKMAFGTGHHATTAGMIRLLLSEELEGKRVIDMGTGTGILAILCKKRGASAVDAIEIDPFALANAEENGVLNKCEINWICGSAENLENLEVTDYFLANINLNVILADLPKYELKIKKGGKLLLSGFYNGDLPKIEGALSDKFEMESKVIDNDWVAAVFKKL